MTFKIKDKEYELKYSIRAMMMYENITGESFNPSNLTNVLTFFYCMVVSSSKDYSYTFEEFLDYIDENPTFINDITEWIGNTNKVEDTLKKN